MLRYTYIACLILHKMKTAWFCTKHTILAIYFLFFYMYLLVRVRSYGMECRAIWYNYTASLPINPGT
jgi:hypothetical protein